MSEATRQHLFSFWELLDELLNLLLLGLIGIEFIALPVSSGHMLFALIAIPAVLLARLVSVAAPLSAMRLFRPFAGNEIRILTWELKRRHLRRARTDVA